MEGGRIPRMPADRMSVPASQLHSSGRTSQVEVLSLWNFISEISIKLLGSEFEGLMAIDGAIE